MPESGGTLNSPPVDIVNGIPPHATETSKGVLILTADDVTTEQELAAVEAASKVFPELHPSVMVTADPEFLQRNSERLRRLRPGVHIDLFEHTIPGDDKGLFGEGGELLRILQQREQGNYESRIPEEWIPLIRAEMIRQVHAFKTYIGVEPSHLSYHYGMHHFGELISLYANVAEELHIPFRWAEKYKPGVTPTSNLHPDVFVDEINLNPHLQPYDIIEEVLRALEAGSGKYVEICLHLGQPFASSARQEEILSQLSFRERLEAAGIEIGTWGRLEAARAAVTAIASTNDTAE